MPRADKWVAVEPEFTNAAAEQEIKVAPPVSAYQFFQREMTQSIKRNLVLQNDGVNPDLKTLSKAVSEHWHHGLTPDEKERFENLAREDRTRYAMESHAREVAKAKRQEQRRKEHEVTILSEGQRRTRRTVLPPSSPSGTSATDRKPRQVASSRKRPAPKAVNSDEESFRSDESEASDKDDSDDYGSDEDEDSNGSDEDDSSSRNDEQPSSRKRKSSTTSTSATKSRKKETATEAVHTTKKQTPAELQRRAKQQEKSDREDYILKRQNKLRSERAEQAKRRLQFLLQQSDIFSHFSNVKEDKTLLMSRSKTKTDEQSTTANAADAEKLGEGGGDSTLHRRTGDEDGTLPETGGEGSDKLTKSRNVTNHEEEEYDLAEPENSVQTYLTQQPSELGFGTMRAYQLEGLNWMIRLQENGVNGILADEMGLGKTLQSISILVYQRQFQDVNGPHLVVVPKSTLSNWMNELKRWGPKLRPLCFHGSKDERQDMVQRLLQPATFNDAARTWDVCVTTYEVCNSDRQILNKFAWNYLIIDEAHRLKNEQSIFSKTVRTFETKYRLLLTGTPLQNNLHEMWALLNFLVPDVFADSEEFDRWFNLDIDDDEKKNKLIHQLHKILRPFMLRRLKADVETSLPRKHETILFVGMSAMQKKLYKDLLMRDLEVLQGKGGSNRTALLNVVMQLRKCAGHPYLFPGVEDRTLPPLGSHLVENCGKMVLLDKLLKKLKENGHRVLLFTQMTRILDILEDYLVMRQYKYCRIDGNTSYDEREERIDAFNAPDSDKFLFLLSTRAGGLGINLQTADIVILYDSDWNPQADLQAQDRAHRIGQKREVQVFRLVTENTIEEKIVERAQQKLKLDAMVVQQGRLQGKEKMSREALLDAVRFGADAIFKSKESSITDDDIDLILNSGRKRTEELNEKLQKADKGNMLDFKLDGGGLTGTHTFEGIDYSKFGQNNAQSELFHILDIGKRERKQVAYNEDHIYRQGPGGGGFGSDKRGGGGDSGIEIKKVLPKFLRLPRMEEWQMFDRDALEALQEIEEEAFKKLPEDQQKLPASSWAAAAATSGSTEKQGDGNSNDAAEAATALPPRLLSKEQEQQKKLLLGEGFPDWERRHYVAFVRACAKYGRTNYEAIAEEVGKPAVFVKMYSEAFWDENIGKQRFSHHEYERVVKTIERGEKKLDDANSLERSTARLISLFENPWNNFGIHHAPLKDRQTFSAEEDRYLICYTRKFGYGQWEAMKMNIRRSPAFRFDYFLRSLPVESIGKRCDQIMRASEKEVEILEKLGREKRAAAAASASKNDDDGGAEEITLPNDREMKLERRLKSNREFEDKVRELEENVESVENEVEIRQRRLRELAKLQKMNSSTSNMNNNSEVPDYLLPELVNLVAKSGPAGIHVLANEFMTSHPGQMTKKKIIAKIDEVATKEKRDADGDTKVVWHIRDEFSHMLDAGTLRFLRKEQEKRMESLRARTQKGRTRRTAATANLLRSSSSSRGVGTKEEDDVAVSNNSATQTSTTTPVERPPTTFPEDYDPINPPKEAKKMFTHFCIHNRKDVKSSLHPEDRKNKQKIHSLLKERWNSLSKEERNVWLEWEEWDEKRYEAELILHRKHKDGNKGEHDHHNQKAAKEDEAKSETAAVERRTSLLSDSGGVADMVHVPKKKKRMVSY